MTLPKEHFYPSMSLLDMTGIEKKYSDQIDGTPGRWVLKAAGAVKTHRSDRISMEPPAAGAWPPSPRTASPAWLALESSLLLCSTLAKTWTIRQ